MAYRQFIGQKTELEKHKRRSWPKLPKLSDSTLLVLFFAPTGLAAVLAFFDCRPQLSADQSSVSACIQVNSQTGQCVIFR